MSDALVLEYLSNQPSRPSSPHHHNPTPTVPTTANMTTPYTLVEPTPSHPAKMPFGRGGAGNRTSSRPLPPSSLTTPDTHSPHSNTSNSHTAPHYSTGRGGKGNMHAAGEERRLFSFDEELAKEGKVGAVPVFHIGRGGKGNSVDGVRRGGGERGGEGG